MKFSEVCRSFQQLQQQQRRYEILRARILRYAYRLRHGEPELTKKIRKNTDKVTKWFALNSEYELTMPNFSQVIRAMV